jgi:putative ABC transport system substrate-binding protein
MLGNPTNRSYAAIRHETEVAARALKVQLRSLEARSPGELENAFRAMTKERASAFILAPDEMLFGRRLRIVDLAAKHRLPGVYENRGYVDAGGLMSYGPSFPAIFRRAATYVDKILKGAKPADLPVEQPTRFELVVNLKTAKALGLTIPRSVLVRADQVIQ